MKFLKYYSTQALEEGFIPKADSYSKIFYRTDDWQKYKLFKGHISGDLTNQQRQRYDRHANEISKLLEGSTKVISLGGGTGALEKRLIKMRPSLHFTVSDIYERDPTKNIDFVILDMTDLRALANQLDSFDTVLIANALSPLEPVELSNLFNVISKSKVQDIIIYSAEDIRLINYLIGILKIGINFFLRRRTMWIGYLYSSFHIKEILRQNKFTRQHFEYSREYGFYSKLRGSSYLAKFTKISGDKDKKSSIKIEAQNLKM